MKAPQPYFTKKLAIWKFTDGYYAIGYEGEKKIFAPNVETMSFIVLEYFQKKIGLTAETYIRESKRSFKEEMNDKSY